LYSRSNERGDFRRGGIEMIRKGTPRDTEPRRVGRKGRDLRHRPAERAEEGTVGFRTGAEIQEGMFRSHVTDDTREKQNGWVGEKRALTRGNRNTMGNRGEIDREVG